jgi:predicted flap endonuclease-1-like 5' DNA nuclease
LFYLLKMMICDWSIGDLPGLSAPDKALLEQLGITTTAELLESTPDAASKQQLAVKLGTKIQFVNKLVALADLARLPGVGCEYNGLLLHTGVISVKQLAQMPAHRLHQQLLRLQVATLQRRDLCPNLDRVQTWVKQAQAML